MVDPGTEGHRQTHGVGQKVARTLALQVVVAL
jgi:hypothetical protein